MRGPSVILRRGNSCFLMPLPFRCGRCLNLSTSVDAQSEHKYSAQPSNLRRTTRLAAERQFSRTAYMRLVCITRVSQHGASPVREWCLPSAWLVPEAYYESQQRKLLPKSSCHRHRLPGLLKTGGSSALANVSAYSNIVKCML